MPMQMGFRWYGEGNDNISLADIKQIPGVTSIVWALHHKMPGEIWEEEEIKEVMDQLHAYGFNGDVVESVNVHDDIKIGLPSRDGYIENYKTTIRNLSKFGVKPMHIFGLLGSVMFILGFLAVAGVGAHKLYAMYSGQPYILVTDSPYFYLALTTMILGTQLFLAGFLGEMIARNSTERNKYQVEKEIG